MRLADTMVDAVRQGVSALGEAPRARLLGYVESRRTAEGAYRGRSDEGDLYYTAFAVDCLHAAGHDVSGDAALTAFLAAVDVESLDLIHLACLARCRLRVGPERLPAGMRARLTAGIRRHATPDGGYDVIVGSAGATPYGVFLARGALEDLDEPAPEAAELIRAVAGARVADGSYANERGMEDGATPMTAGMVTLAALSGLEPEAATLAWLLGRWNADGGFEVFPDAPMSDLLSTATAMLALRAAGCLPDDVSACREYVGRLWDRARGGFRGHVFDDATDLEYTFYGLMALGVCHG
jgi:hypothetical protein